MFLELTDENGDKVLVCKQHIVLVAVAETDSKVLKSLLRIDSGTQTSDECFRETVEEVKNKLHRLGEAVI